MDTAGLRRFGAVAILLAVLSGCDAGRHAAVSSGCQGKNLLAASGSSAQAIAMDRFIAAYEHSCPGHSLGYTANGSGAGVADFLAGRTDFAGTDSAVGPGDAEWLMARTRCAGAEPWNLPLVFGPIAITYNVFGVDTLTLDGPTIAKIFTGRVTTWDAPEIAALNPGAPLPRQPIAVLFRGDESGTTDNFQRYLQATAGQTWGRGTGKTFLGGIGRPKQGNEGTAAAIPRTPGAVTYTEWSFAQRQQLPAASIITTAGPQPVPLNVETVLSSVNEVRAVGQGQDLVLDTTALYRPTRPGAYPIMLATYELVCSKYPDRATAEGVKEFLTAAIAGGQEGLADHGYAPLPDVLAARLRAAAAAIAWAED